METFSTTFSQHSCLKLHYTMKNERLQELEALRSVKIAVYGMKCVDLFTDIIRITGVHQNRIR